jgi:voltage-gated potassium channel
MTPAARNSKYVSDSIDFENETKAEHAVHTWERWSTIPLAILALVYLGLYSLEVLGHWTAPVLFDFVAISDVIWVIFILDFLGRFILTHDKLRFMKTNAIEFVSLILPFFRAFRMFRVIIALGFLSRVGRTLSARINIYVGLILPLLIYVCALGVYDAEHKAPGANITQFGDAIWWAFVTIGTIGYGDYYPVTFEGRAIAVLLMIAGLAFVSIITVSVATMFLNRLEYDLIQKKKAPAERKPSSEN